ncbi:MAG: D-glycero-beta-D-manno-heptose 1,7-bisphosphate 7-phosphatase [Gammaproteobacteria bacterium]|nr:D-glycero-beta-D-manno-heptose 1,7-bisphosphate 7-phosphatase [Gammaproteobacteria bacterium]
MKLVIMERDGVINEDVDDTVTSPAEWKPIPGSLAAIARLHRAGWRVVVATNQSGIARQRLDLDALTLIHDRMHRSVAEAGGLIDAVFFCPHAADEDCECRKPKPGLYLDIARRLRVDLKSVPVIGHSLDDLQAARAVGAHPILVKTGKGTETLSHHDLGTDVSVFRDLTSAVDALLTPDAGS